MGSECRLAYIPPRHPAINQGAETRIPPTDTLRPAQLGPKPGENTPAKSLKRRLKRHLPNDL